MTVLPPPAPLAAFSLAALLLWALPTPWTAGAHACAGVSGRPAVGLVLGGGGARGAAHIGVLKVLRDMKVPVDCVAGTSMGAVVGGLYAAGLSPERIEDEINTLDWDAMFVDASPRAMRPYHIKEEDRYYLGSFKAGFSDGELKLPLAYIQGQKLDLALNRLTLEVAGVHDFDALPIPFRAVASDIATGDAVVLEEGKLAKAIRASMAVPGIFAPVTWNGHLLVDGGIADNLPVNVARAMGADVVIAVDVASPLLGTDEITSALDVVDQLTNLLVQRNSQQQIATLGEGDVLLRPELGDFSSAAFSTAGRAVIIGVRAADAARAQLAHLATDEAGWQDWLARHQPLPDRAPIIGRIEIRTNARIEKEVITSRLHVREGQRLNLGEIDADITRIYGLDLFETVQYELKEENGETVLLIEANERSWGPNYLQLGLFASDDFKGDNRVNLSLSYLLTEVNRLNGRVRLGVQLGQDPTLMASFYQPLDAADRWFVSGHASHGKRNTYIYENYRMTSNYLVEGTVLSLAAGRNFGTWGQLRAGLRRFSGDSELRLGEPQWSSFDFQDVEAIVNFGTDTFDDYNFPRHGQRFALEWRGARTALGSDNDYTQITGTWNRAWTRGADTLIAGADFGVTLDDDAPVQALYRTGGLLNLSGFQQNQLSGQDFAVGRLVYMRDLGRLGPMPWYAGTSLEYGNVWQHRQDMKLNNGIWAGSAFLGLDTFVGPVYLAYGQAQHGFNSFYLFIGRPF